MIPPPTHIQSELDRVFPGVRLEWNAHLGYWVLTDDHFHIDGTLSYDGYTICPRALQGIEPYPYTLRRIIFVMGDLQTGERYPLHCDRILETLRKAYRGVHPDQVEEWLDEIEASEAAEEARGKAAERERAHASAETAWNGMKRSTFGAGIRSTPWSFAKALDKEFAERERERNDDAGQELDQIAAEEAAAGRVTMLNSLKQRPHVAGR